MDPQRANQEPGASSGIPSAVLDYQRSTGLHYRYDAAVRVLDVGGSDDQVTRLREDGARLERRLARAKADGQQLHGALVHAQAENARLGEGLAALRARSTHTLRQAEERASALQSANESLRKELDIARRALENERARTVSAVESVTRLRAGRDVLRAAKSSALSSPSPVAVKVEAGDGGLMDVDVEMPEADRPDRTFSSRSPVQYLPPSPSASTCTSPVSVGPRLSPLAGLPFSPPLASPPLVPTSPALTSASPADRPFPASSVPRPSFPHRATTASFSSHTSAPSAGPTNGDATHNTLKRKRTSSNGDPDAHQTFYPPRFPGSMPAPSSPFFSTTRPPASPSFASAASGSTPPSPHADKPPTPDAHSKQNLNSRPSPTFGSIPALSSLLSPTMRQPASPSLASTPSGSTPPPMRAAKPLTPDTHSKPNFNFHPPRTSGSIHAPSSPLSPTMCRPPSPSLASMPSGSTPPLPRPAKPPNPDAHSKPKSNPPPYVHRPTSTSSVPRPRAFVSSSSPPTTASPKSKSQLIELPPPPPPFKRKRTPPNADCPEPPPPPPSNSKSANSNSNAQPTDSNPPKNKLGISHLPLMYETLGDTMYCRACRRAFAGTAAWAELVGHAQGEHPEACAEMEGLRPAQVVEQRHRMQYLGKR